MPTEKQKMLAGQLYLATDDELSAERLRCRRLLRELNNSDPADEEGRRGILGLLLGGFRESAWIEPPFHCDYGSNILVGERFYANFDCVFLDPGRIEIGDDV